MYYPEEVIEEVRSRNDIVDVISSYVGLKRAGSNYTCCCPFHNEKTPSFSVSKQKQMFYCFGCHEGGNVFSFVMKYEHFTFQEAVKSLAARVGYALPEVEPSEDDKRRADRRQKLRDVNTAAAAYFYYLLTKTERGKHGYQYFREKRGFTDETIGRFGLGFSDIYADDLYKYLKSKGFDDEVMRDAGLVEFDEKRGPHDKFWNRVMVPILDQNGKCIAFGGRVLGDGKPKYMNTKETELFDKSRTLFAFYLARRSRRRGVILCEGYMDVISQHQAGFDNALASLGTAFTPGQASLIKRFTNEVYLAYDSDNAGTMAAKKAIRVLRSQGMSQRVIDLSPHKDPDEFLAAEGAEAYEERIRDAIPGRLFLIRQAAAGYRKNDPEEKAAMIRDVAGQIAESQDPAERASYIETVAEELMLDAGLLKQEVTRIGMMGLAEKEGMSGKEDAEAFVNPETERRVHAGAVYMKDTGRPDEKKGERPDETEAHLLTHMVNRPELFGKLKNYISEEDFSGKVKEVATQLFRQYRDTGQVNPAALLNRFEESGEQREIAGILSRDEPFEIEKEAEEKALTEMVKKLKLREVDRKLRGGEGSAFELAKKKKDIQKLEIHL